MGNYIVDLYSIMSTKSELVTPYSVFHLVCFALVIAFSIFLCVFFRNCSDRTMRILLFVAWVAMVLLEILDQFVDGTSVLEDGTLFFDYQWYRFPFQLCSTALWITPFIILIPEGVVRDGLIGYMTLFSFFGGLAVMFYPADVFTSYIVTNVHTMVHHGLQVALGVFFISHERHKYNLRYFVGGTVTFLCLVGIACVLNEVAHEIFLAYGQDDTFNMFYFSPYHDCTLPVLSEIYKMVPYPAFMLIYCGGFIFIAFIIYFVASLINHITDRVRHKEKYV